MTARFASGFKNKNEDSDCSNKEIILKYPKLVMLNIMSITVDTSPQCPTTGKTMWQIRVDLIFQLVFFNCYFAVCNNCIIIQTKYHNVNTCRMWKHIYFGNDYFLIKLKYFE